ncbi:MULTISPECIES: PQQ-dependent dehydrogenase, methanol/ethanol family [Hydrocarboniphaga]|jgi:quinohemoprotein ethanol dehydrogenase|uniref:Quinohemeprotein ethanol dehydrogenase n=1 Tax=Hydrocarboniphaga effusa AP103 TaxID=1172194 RepID=I8I1V6_9GAMM|nr:MULTISPECIES: PQQ-dependent dehydrogenase, methanol/ethanol family [Hydrocarboniphaga]EIT69771.1 quinohemeprotein ethanol dehydrogenase [Hydrocarboniphaga effusa AP103]MDZ4078847.1 PQQ-dependent dehydrogenase, methanol/ethanol family [Hydrocarboniphaga sp.]
MSFDPTTGGRALLGLRKPAWVFAALACMLGASIGATAAGSSAQNKIVANAATGKEWPANGLDYSGTRFSRLQQINADNVKRLGLAWSYDLESTRGVEATPIVTGGVMYVTASWSVVHAIDARSGKRLWTYDPKVPRDKAYKACCDVVNRGVAVEDGKVFVGSLDGRLIALDASNGKKLWEQDTIIDHTHAYTVTGAPRVFKGKVIIGNGGAEFGVRGYITAYDVASGKQRWRWFTVPGDPSKPFEDESMAKAAKTWDPSAKYWENGGGGTVWNSMVFDPELNLMYVGTGNGAPWSHRQRSPAGGDNLYLASIVALDPDTGAYVWHYQETPGDNWDYTSVQDLILADIKLDGKARKVVLHAPKNGFFFVVDRTNGQFISANNFVDVNWATGYDAKGRPIEVPEARSPDQPFDAIPGPFGAHNWHSMSYSPITGLAYFPAQNIPLNLAEDKRWKGHNSNVPGQPMSGIGWNTAMQINAEPPKSKPFGKLIAWDPVKQKAAWTHENVAPWNGGTLVTAGNLVFQGTADARLVAYNATNGEPLWNSAMGTGVIAAPITYELDGKQYVTIAAGWGGVFGQSQRASDGSAPGTVYTFVLDGKTPLPAFTKYQLGSLVAGVAYDPKDVAEGTALYVSNCVFCHGVPGVDKGGNIPNLGYVDKAIIENLDKFVFAGPFVSKGMPDFTGKLQPADVPKLKAFIQGTADAVRPKAASTTP